MESILPMSAERIIHKLESIFPAAFEQGKLNIEKLISLFPGELLHQDEKFELCWPGKRQSIALAEYPPLTKLAFCKEQSINAGTTKNILIEGDNLEALRILQQDYYGKIKTIYIDPPYNTGNNSFTYADKFYEGPLPYLKRNGSRNGHTKQNGHLHSSWLSMMYPRLILARKLLTEDGVIFISIDDNEVACLKLIMDEIFGGDNYIEIFCWAKSETPANLSKKSKKVVEYILCYQKIKDSKKFKGIRKKSISSNGLLNQSNKVSTLIFPPNIARTNLHDQEIIKGTYGTDKYDIELMENTQVKDNVFILPVVLKAKFKWTQPKLNMEISNGTVINIPTLRFSPSYERFEYGAEVPPNLINSKVGVATNETAGSELASLFGAKVFDFPKPPSLIKYLLGFADDPEGIVLDFFAGSGSTAQAVLEMNKKDNGNRKFICVQLNEKTPEHSTARKNGFETISAITKKRIELVLKNSWSPGAVSQMTDRNRPGFKYYKLK